MVCVVPVCVVVVDLGAIPELHANPTHAPHLEPNDQPLQCARETTLFYCPTCECDWRLVFYPAGIRMAIYPQRQHGVQQYVHRYQ